MEKKEKNYFDSSNLILYVWRWRKPLIGFSLLAAVLAAVFSAPYFIKPKFESVVVVFPSTTTSVSKAVLPQNFSSRGQDILEFGTEEEADRLVQILRSDEIRETIIDKYNLMDHYDIDPDQDLARTKLTKRYESNITFNRTEYMSINIKVLDTDPDTAAMIANDISNLLNDVRNRIQRERALKGLRIVENQYKGLRREIEEMEDELSGLRMKGVHDYERQSGVLSEQHAQAMIEYGLDHPSVRALSAQLDTLAKYGGRYVSLREELSLLREDMAEVKVKYDQAKVDVNESLPATFVVNHATPAEHKKYPIRWLLVLTATVATFISVLIAIIILETIQRAMKSSRS